MPNLENIQKASERRRLRQAAKDGTAEQLTAETLALSIKTEEQAKAKPATPQGRRVEQPSQVAGKSQKAKREVLQEQAKVQAEADVRVDPAEIGEDEIAEAMAKARADGKLPPLHILNAQAKIADRAMRDEAREMANAVGRVAYDQALGRVERNKHSRQRKMEKSIVRAREMEKLQAKQA